MKIALFAGSFDPITNGHIDVLQRGAKLFDRVVVAIANNPNKKSFIPLDTRLELVQKSVNDIPNVEVTSYDGLTVDYAKKIGAKYLLRGLRNSIDFEYEKQLSLTNQYLDSDIETVFILSKSEYEFVSSSTVRELYNNNANFSEIVPNTVYEYLKSI